MAQVERYGILINPAGNRLLVCTGTHAFTTNGKKVTLTVKLRYLVAAHCRPNQTPPAGAKSASFGGIWPYVTASMFTLPTAGKIQVNRLTAGGSLGAKFSYTLIGY